MKKVQRRAEERDWRKIERHLFEEFRNIKIRALLVSQIFKLICSLFF